MSNIESAIKSAYYMQFRYLHNKVLILGIPSHLRAAIFLFVRNFAYSGMFRYNSNGDFNVPYGGIGYNNKNIRKKIDYLKSPPLEKLLMRTTVESLDFEKFFYTYSPNKNDFVFLDPPYDTEFSTYGKNEFTKDDQARLASYLVKDCKAKWMLIIKNTEYIHSLYDKKGLNIKFFDKTYLVSFINRNDKNTEHLLITNY